jgi:hypothetical protein
MGSPGASQKEDEMSCMTKWLLGSAAGIAVVLIASTVHAEDKSIKPIKEWKSAFLEVKDEPLMKEAPKSGYIADAEAWTKLWKAWRFEKEQPVIDFKKQVVLVSVADGAVNRWLRTGLKLTDKGDLRSDAPATEIAGPGFIYLIQVVDREGIRTINGKAITDK